MYREEVLQAIDVLKKFNREVIHTIKDDNDYLNAKEFDFNLPKLSSELEMLETWVSAEERLQ